jgi:ring-1,2-phenylacetyl-CoA epoxidase subunit PaaD
VVDASAGASSGAQSPVRATPEQVLGWLDTVMDPEVPVVSVVGLGIVREVIWVDEPHAKGGSDDAARLQVVVTPTYSGCPATEVIARSIRESLALHGVPHVEVLTRLSPAWTTDWMSAQARDALRAYGIAPPVERAPGADGSQVVDIGALLDPAARAAVPCPLCGSSRTRLLSQFGSTACKALYQCNSCLEPFDYFKPH